MPFRKESFDTTWLLCLVLMVLSGCRHYGNQAAPGIFPSFSGTTGRIDIDQAALDVQVALAQSMERKGKTFEAMAAYKQLVENKRLPEAMHRLGVLHDQQGDFAAAIQNYESALQHQPQNADLLCDLGYSYYLQQNWKASETHLRRAIELSPGLERAHNNLALLMARLDNPEETLAAFRKATTDEKVALANFNFVFGKTNALATDGISSATGEIASATAEVGPTQSNQQVVERETKPTDNKQGHSSRRLGPYKPRSVTEARPRKAMTELIVAKPANSEVSVTSHQTRM